MDATDAPTNEGKQVTIGGKKYYCSSVTLFV